MFKRFIIAFLAFLLFIRIAENSGRLSMHVGQDQAWASRDSTLGDTTVFKASKKIIVRDAVVIGKPPAPTSTVLGGRVDTIYVKTLDATTTLHAAGSASAPSVAGSSDTNTGLTWLGSDTLGVNVNSQYLFKFYQAESNAGLFEVPGLDAAATPIIRVSTKTSSTGSARIEWIEGTGTGAANNMGWIMQYDASNNYLAIRSRDSDGASADADIIRIPDGGVAVNGNGAFVDNQFDYFCPVCAWHQLEPGNCPKDGSRLMWNDDVESIKVSIQALKENPYAQTILHKAGILVTDRDGWQGISMNKASYFALSALVQQSNRITRENALMQDQIDALKQEKAEGSTVTLWAMAVMVGVLLFASQRKGLLVVLLALSLSASAHADTLEDHLLVVLKKNVASITALRDSLIVAYPADSVVTLQTVTDSLQILRAKGMVRDGQNQIRLTSAGLTPTTKNVASTDLLFTPFVVEPTLSLLRVAVPVQISLSLINTAGVHQINVTDAGTANSGTSKYLTGGFHTTAGVVTAREATTSPGDVDSNKVFLDTDKSVRIKKTSGFPIFVSTVTAGGVLYASVNLAGYSVQITSVVADANFTGSPAALKVALYNSSGAGVDPFTLLPSNGNRMDISIRLNVIE